MSLPDFPLVYGSLNVFIDRAEDLRNEDSDYFSSSNLGDAYVRVALDTHKIVKTKVKNDDLNPIWKESEYSFFVFF